MIERSNSAEWEVAISVVSIEWGFKIPYLHDFKILNVLPLRLDQLSDNVNPSGLLSANRLG